MTQEPHCTVSSMDPFAREFLAKCHAEAHHRSLKAGQPCRACTAIGRILGTCWRACIGRKRRSIDTKKPRTPLRTLGAVSRQYPLRQGMSRRNSRRPVDCAPKSRNVLAPGATIQAVNRAGQAPSPRFRIPWLASLRCGVIECCHLGVKTAVSLYPSLNRVSRHAQS